MNRNRRNLAWVALIGSITVCGPCAACSGLFSIGGIGTLIDSTQPYRQQFGSSDWLFLAFFVILTMVATIVGLMFFVWGIITLLHESEARSGRSVQDTHAEQISTLPVKLWTPSEISGDACVLGFPVGIVLASINWIRMGMRNKAIAHLIAGAIGVLVLPVVLVLIPGDTGLKWLPYGVGMVVNISVTLYLYLRMKNDIERFRAANHKVQNANSLVGCLIGLGVLGLFLVFILAYGLVLLFVLALAGIPIPQ